MCLQSQAAFDGAPLTTTHSTEDPFVNPIQWLWTAVSMYINTHYYLGGFTVHTSSGSPPSRGWWWGHHQQFIRQERNYTRQTDTASVAPRCCCYWARDRDRERWRFVTCLVMMIISLHAVALHGSRCTDDLYTTLCAPIRILLVVPWI